MLYEIITQKQLSTEYSRRWFESEEVDLVVWTNTSKQITSFQLCYRTGFNEKVLTWKLTSGFSHEAVDTGESRHMHHKSTPILIPDGEFAPIRVVNMFAQISQDIDNEIATFVLEKLNQNSA